MDVSKLEKYRNQIKEITQGDDFVADMILFEAGRSDGFTTLNRHPFFFHGLLAAVTNAVFPWKGLKRKVEIKPDEDFIFVSCPDPIFRTKTIGLIAGNLKYSVVYLPNFHISASLRYHKYFTEKGTRAFFPTIRLRHVLQAQKAVAGFKRQCAGLDDSIECKKLLSTLSSYLIYNELVKNYLNSADSFKGKWLLEHDKFYFMSTAANLHLCGKETTMLQHGVFFRPSFNYIPLYCTKVLCCSEREKKIYAENGVAENRVMVFGAPLQTLQQEKDLSEKPCQYDLLLMMTDVNDNNKALMQQVMTYVRQNYENVLVRMRPRSRKKDESILAEQLNGMTISSEGRTIFDDISSCKKVISFSEDANVEIAKCNKPFIYVWTEGRRDAEVMSRCATEENYKEEIQKFMTQDFYSTFSKEQYKEVLGETDVNVLRQKFEDYIRS